MRKRQDKKDYKKKLAAKNEIHRQLGKPPVSFMGFDMEVAKFSGGLYFKPVKGN